MAELLQVLGVEIVQAGDRFRETARRQEAEQAGDRDRELLRRAAQRADGEQGEGRVARRGIVKRFSRSHFHRLHFGHDLALDVPGDDHEHGGHGGHPGPDARHRPVHGQILADILPAHVPQTDRQDERSGRHIRGDDHVREGDQLHLIGEDGTEVGELGTFGDRVVGVADGILHERIRRQDEIGGQHCPDRHQIH